MKDENIIVIEELVKIYKTKDIEVLALQGLDLTVKKGEIVAIIGSSGSGKSTLLNMIGGLDKPSSGRLRVKGKDLFSFTASDYVKYKRDTVGFVWQNSARNLIPYLTAYENIELPMLLSGKIDREYIEKLLELVGLKDRRNNKLSELSGGEQQRIAIATALANKPEILLADEPTGAVDTATAGSILNVFRTLRDSLGLTVVIVTHDNMISNHVERVVAIRDGKTSSEFILKEKYRRAALSNSAERSGDSHLHDEFIVVDRYGRLQIPREFLESVGIDKTGKARVKLEEDKIIITNSQKEN